MAVSSTRADRRMASDPLNAHCPRCPLLTVCFLDSDDGTPARARASKRVKRAPVGKANPVAVTVKMEEDEKSSGLEMFGGSDPEDVDALPAWLCSPRRADQVLAEAI